MMKLKTIFAAAAMLPVLWACQSDAPQEIATPGRVFTVKASLPDPTASRAVITYGNQDEDRETFEWYMKDEWITVFNLTKFSEFHLHYNAPLLKIDSIDGIKATFALDPDTEEERITGEKFLSMMEPGDIIFAILGAAGSNDLADASGSDNLISYFAGSHLYDQSITEDPTKPSALYFMHQMIRMYDIAKVGEDKQLPELHFKHLSAIMRVTLRNETGGPLFTKPSDLVFEYNTGADCCFIYGYSKISVEGNETDGFYLKENFKAPEERHPLNPTPPDTTTYLVNKVTHKINEMNQKTTLANGDTYELYAVVAPRIGYALSGDSLNIHLYDGVESGYGKYDDCFKYSITIKDFNIPIEAGKRYWFNLTAVKEENEGETVTKLMFTSEWKAAHPELDSDNQ